MKKDLIIIGAGGHAKSIIEVIESCNEWNICGLIGLENEKNIEILGYKVIGTDEDLVSLRNKFDNCFNAVGQIRSFNEKLQITNKLIELNFNIPKLIASTALVSKTASIGKGTSIGHGAIVNSDARIGSHSIINSKTLVEHDSCIGNFCHVSTGVLINGGVSIGNYSFVGSGCILRECISIPEKTVISAGTRVMGWPIKNPNKDY